MSNLNDLTYLFTFSKQDDGRTGYVGKYQGHVVAFEWFLNRKMVESWVHPAHAEKVQSMLEALRINYLGTTSAPA